LQVTGCITNIASDSSLRSKLLCSGFIDPLSQLASNYSIDDNVVKNCVGALLNLTQSVVFPFHSNDKDTRRKLCEFEAVPVALCKLINHSREKCQFYSITALTNISVDEIGRTSLWKSHDRLIKKLLVQCRSASPQVAGQSILCLRNLASDEFFQLKIVEKGSQFP
jgi:vacuolar protein 8